MVEEKVVLITLKEYEHLVEDSVFLNYLIENGVDNWSGYGYPGQEIDTALEECDKKVVGCSSKTILINGQEYKSYNSKISYDDILKMAGTDNNDRVTVRTSMKFLSPGEYIEVVDGMLIEISEYSEEN